MRVAGCLGVASMLVLALPGKGVGQEAAGWWSERETRLANEYLALLVEQPEEGRVLDLLWQLYEARGETGLLTETIAAQAKAQPHVAVRLVWGQLLKKRGDVAGAAELFEAAVRAEPGNRFARRAAARASLELGRRSEALQHLRALGELMPVGSGERVAVWMEAGDVALGMERVEEAAGWWEKAAAEQAESLAVARQVAQRLLQAGLSSRAAVFFRALAERASPREKLDALQDLARILAHADDFEGADAALRDGLALTHFRDGRHGLLFRQRVRLHERFGRLEELEAGLAAAVERAAPAAREAAWLARARFYELTVNAEERLKALRALVEVAPEEESHRWEWVRAILDHGEVEEARQWLDAKLAAAGARAPTAWVLLRAEADLRAGEAALAARRLMAWVEAAGTESREAVEKEVLGFAQPRNLDEVVEKILRERVKREPGAVEPVFELAGHLRGRRRVEEARQVLDAYVAGGVKAEDQRRRLGEVASFWVGGSEVETALEQARRAAELPGAGREEWLRLADLLVDRGAVAEAEAWIDRAWEASATDEERLEVDERLLPVLMGEAGQALVAPKVEFTLPSVFTGSQFAREDPARPNAATPAMRARLEKVVAASQKVPEASARQFRVAWWAVRCGEAEMAYAALRALRFEAATGRARELSLEAENLLLELAQTDENRALALRCLESLRQRDKGNGTRYVLRQVELMLEADQQRRETAKRAGAGEAEGGEPVGAEAAALLRSALAGEPLNDLLLSALSRILLLQQRPTEALKLWQEAAARASGAAKIPLLEREAELLLAQDDLRRHVDAGLKILELESDVGRRREAFKRFLDRLTAADAGGRELEVDVVGERLRLVVEALKGAAARHPFDGFYPEALAQAHLRAEQPEAAFEAMRRAYYTAPETPFSLDQLRDAALRVEDVAQAVYFQKQIAAAAPPGEVSKESRFLVELMERDFQMEEADQVRRRLERRFSQDVKALEGLAQHYEETGQDEALLRVLEQVARVRPWDGRAWLAVALQGTRMGDAGLARERLEEVLRRVPTGSAWKASSVRVETLPLPLTWQRAPGKRGTAADVADGLESVAGLEGAEVESLQQFLKAGRPEYARLPETPELLRLRAIEELARLEAAAGGDRAGAWVGRWSEAGLIEERPLEVLWALSGGLPGAPESAAVEGARRLAAAVERVLGAIDGPKPGRLEAAFARVWLLLRGHALESVLGWVGQGRDLPEAEALREAGMDRRARLLQACLVALVDAPDHAFRPGELTRVAQARLLPSTALLELTRKLQDRQQYEAALELGEWLRQDTRTLSADYALMMARMAEAAERWDLARHYLKVAVESPTTPGRYQGVYDPFLYGVGALARSAASRVEQQTALQRAWGHLQATAPSDMTRLRRAVVAGLAGAEGEAVAELDRWVREDFLGNRPLGRRPGGLMPQGSLRFEDAPQAQSLWEETREVGALLTQQGLAGVTAEAEARWLERWGPAQLGPRPGYEFSELRINQLIRSLRATDYANRLRLIRRWLAPVDMRVESSVELLGELGGKLEAAGMAREAIEVFRLLPPRAPTNSEYATWLLRACEGAREVEPGKGFALQLIHAVPPYKPPTPGDETLREMHARFLAADLDVEGLRELAFRENPVSTLPGRLPPETAYLRELARLLGRLGRNDEALEAWDRYQRAFLHHDDDGLEPDTESVLNRARLLKGTGRREEALGLLKQRPAAATPGQLEHEAVLLEAELVLEQETEGAASIRPLMLQVVEHHDVATVVRLASLLREKGRVADALSLLTQAERRKAEEERFRLRLETVAVLRSERRAGVEALKTRVAALFRTRVRDAESEGQFLDWVGELAAALQGSEHAEERAVWGAFWLGQARSGPDRVLGAAAVCAWAARGGGWPEAEGGAFPVALTAWRAAVRMDEHQRCLVQAARRLMDGGLAKEAWETAELTGSLPTLRRQGRLLPVMVEAARALGQEHAISELFAEVVHMTVPGGARLEEWVTAFEKVGRKDLARELAAKALEQAGATDSLSSALAKLWVRLLGRHGEHAEAESFLLRHDYLLTVEMPELLVELYRSWGRLGQLPEEVKRFGLARGIEREVLWRAGGLREATAGARP